MGATVGWAATPLDGDGCVVGGAVSGGGSGTLTAGAQPAPGGVTLERVK